MSETYLAAHRTTTHSIKTYRTRGRRRSGRRCVIIGAAACAALLGLARPAICDVYSWVAGNSSWSDPTAWSPVGVPWQADDSAICAGGYTATLDIDVAIADLTLTSGAAISGTHSFSTSGFLYWSSGAFNGIGTTTSNGQLHLASGNHSLDQRQFNNAGVATWSGGGLYTSNGGAFNNLAGAALSIVSDTSYSLDGTINNFGNMILASGTTYLGNGTIANAAGATIELQSGNLWWNYGSNFILNSGMMRMTGAGNTFHISAAVVNTGTVAAEAGVLSIDNGLTNASTGTLSASATGTLHLNGALAGTFVGAPAGFVGLSSGNLEPSSSAGGATINLTAGGFSWSGGSIQGGGTLNNQGKLIASTNSRNLYTVISNSGTFLNTSGSTYFGNGTLENRTGGLLEMSGGEFYQSFGNNEVINAGTFRKTGASTVYFNVPVVNSGLIDAQEGLLRLEGGLSGSGTLNAAGAAAININGSFSGTFAGAPVGAVGVSGGWLYPTVAGATINFSAAGFTWSGGDIDASAGSLSNLGEMSMVTSNRGLHGRLVNFAHLTLVSGQTYLSSAAIANQPAGVFDMFSGNLYTNGGVNSIENAGIIRKTTSGTAGSNVPVINSGTIAVQDGTLYLDGGLSGSGTLTASLGATLNLNGEFQGSFAGAVSGSVGIKSGSLYPVGAGATVNLSAAGFTWEGGNIYGSGSVGVASAGHFVFAADVGRSLSGSLTNLSGGAMTYAAGALYVGNGTIANAAGALLEFQSGNIWSSYGANALTNSGLARMNGAGTVRITIPVVNTGTITADAGTLSIEAGISNTSVGTLTAQSTGGIHLSGPISGTFRGNPQGFVGINGGTVSPDPAGGAWIDFSGAGFTWLWGNIDGGGTLNNLGTIFATTNSRSLYAVLSNSGTFIHQSGPTYAGNGTINNLTGGLLEMQGGDIYNSFGANAINNPGTIRKTGPAESGIGIPVVNAGLIDAQTGILRLDAGLSGTGTLGAATSGTLNLNGSFSGSFAGAPAGFVGVGWGNLLPAAAGATINFSGAGFTWSGGNIDGSAGSIGLTNLNAMLINQNAKGLYGRLSNAGNIAHVSSNLYVGEGTIANQAGATYELQNGNIYLSYGNCAFNNAGTLRKTPGTNVTINVPINNTGTVDVQAGALSCGVYSQSAGLTRIADGATVYVSSGTFTGGTLSGSGAMNGPLTVRSSAVISPGSSIGTITLTALTLDTGASLSMELAAPGTGDRVNVTNTDALNLAGATAINLLDAGGIGAGSYTLIDYAGSFSGSFGNLSIASLPVGLSGTLSINSENTSIDVNITGVVGPSQWALTGGGDWHDPASWTGAIPSAPGDVANFLGRITAPSTINAGPPVSVGAIRFDNANSYTISGGHGITIQMAQANEVADITVYSGSHVIASNLALMSPLDFGIPAGSSLTLSGALFNAGAYPLAKLSDGTLTISGPQVQGAGAFIDVMGGTLNLNSDVGSSSNFTVGINVFNNAAVNFGSTQHLASVAISSGSLTLPAGGDKVLVTRELGIGGTPTAPTGKLDLNDNDLIIEYTGPSPIADVVSLIRSARGPGNWWGNGITSSLADASQHGLGYSDTPATGGGTVLVKYTWYGDANLDGQVDISDLGRLATAWQTSGSWVNGDFDYSGFIDISDLGKLATNWQAGVGNPLGPSFDQALASVGLAGAIVPEPAALILIGLSLTGMRWRPRRRA